jgi:ceramide glucosyltransferase
MAGFCRVLVKSRLPNSPPTFRKAVVVLVSAILALLSSLLVVWQWVAAWRFPLHSAVAGPAFAPPVALLKPIKGWDSQTAPALRSWLEQSYPAAVQVLFGIASPDDPAVEHVRRLIQEHPAANASLVLCRESLGANAKVSTLIQLLRLTEHDIVIVSDADVIVPPQYLLNCVAPLRDPAVGLVNSFYRLDHPSTLAMRCEAIAINADFWSQVLQGQTLAPLDFALGAVMTTRREQLKAIGGFEALADYLADDFQLGNRIVRTGKRIALCPVVVDCLSPPAGWGHFWSHQLRWARTIRACKPVPYALSVLSNATFWPLLWLAIRPQPAVLAVATGCLLLRIIAAVTLQKRLAPAQKSAGYFWLVPIKDLFQFALWLMAFAGNRISWRGQTYRLQRSGKLVPVA